MKTKVIIHYKSDSSDIPYCAFVNPAQLDYECAWSNKSFEEARKLLLDKLKGGKPTPPASEEVEVEVRS